MLLDHYINLPNYKAFNSYHINVLRKNFLKAFSLCCNIICSNCYFQLESTCITEDEMMGMFISKIDRELVQVSRRETKSVLRERGFSNFTFEEVLVEMRSLCPTVFKILSAMIQLDLNQDRNTAPLALIYAVLMFKRFHELSRVLNTVLLYSGNASKEVRNFLAVW